MSNIEFSFFFLVINIFIYLFYKRISRIINVYDIPNNRKIHKKKTPLIGGYIVFFNLVLFTLLIFFDFYDINLIKHIFISKSNYLIFFIVSTLIFFIGTLDDQINLNANVKLLLLLFSISLLIFLDDTVIISQLRWSFTDNIFFLQKYSHFFTILCFLLFINACNMFDGINLQSTTYYIFLTFFLLKFNNLNFFIIFFLITLLPIFALNKNGKIFMGDSGVYLCSFILSFIIIKNYNIDMKIDADFIFILMMLPGVDMFRLFLLRISKKKNPFAADANHIHHLLLKKFSSNKTLLIINLIIVIPTILSFLNISSFLIVILFLVLYVIFIFKSYKLIKFD